MENFEDFKKRMMTGGFPVGEIETLMVAQSIPRRTPLSLLMEANNVIGIERCEVDTIPNMTMYKTKIVKGRPVSQEFKYVNGELVK